MNHQNTGLISEWMQLVTQGLKFANFFFSGIFCLMILIEYRWNKYNFYLVGVTLFCHTLSFAVFKRHGVTVPARKTWFWIGRVTIRRSFVWSSSGVLRGGRVSGRSGVRGIGWRLVFIFVALTTLIQGSEFFSWVTCLKKY